MEGEGPLTSTIETRPFGSTGENVTVVGLGGSHLGDISLNDGVSTVHCALDLGITYFDTSPLYGASQMILGVALRPRPDKYVLATKLGHFRNPRHFRSVEAIHVQIGENLRTLQRDSVDVLQVHEADWRAWWSDDVPHDKNVDPDQDYDFANAAVTQALREAKEQGLCRFTGVTGNSATETAHALRHVDVDAYLVAGHYDLLWRDLRRESLPLARERGVAMVLGGALRGGTFAASQQEIAESFPAVIRSRFERLYALQLESGLSIVALSVRFLMGDPDITTMLIGAKNPAEVEESAIAAHAGPLPSDLHQAIEALGIP
jgi:L-galactose dehydrogenase